MCRNYFLSCKYLEIICQKRPKGELKLASALTIDEVGDRPMPHFEEGPKKF